LPPPSKREALRHTKKERKKPPSGRGMSAKADRGRKRASSLGNAEKFPSVEGWLCFSEDGVVCEKNYIFI
jgi:hypothetical protein